MFRVRETEACFNVNGKGPGERERDGKYGRSRERKDSWWNYHSEAECEGIKGQ